MNSEYLSTYFSLSSPSPADDVLLIPQRASDDRNTCRSLTVDQHCSTDTALAAKHGTALPCHNDIIMLFAMCRFSIYFRPYRLSSDT